MAVGPCRCPEAGRFAKPLEGLFSGPRVILFFLVAVFLFCVRVGGERYLGPVILFQQVTRTNSVYCESEVCTKNGI